MEKIGQKTAVVNAVKQILGSSFSAGETDVKTVINENQLNSIRDIVTTGIVNGVVSYGKDFRDEKNVRRYVNGMIDNHFRKSKELNGGSKYIPSNPGRGLRDSQLSTLRKLQKTYTDNPEKLEKIQKAISNREDFIKKSREESRKKKSHKVDTSLLPEELTKLIDNEAE